MNDIARPLLSMTNDEDSAPSAKLEVQSTPRSAADHPGAADDRGRRLTVPWRRLPQPESAAALGMILASPRTALLMAQRLGRRIPPSASARSMTSAATRRQEVR